MPVNPFNAPLSIEIKPSLQKYIIVTIPHVLALIFLVFIKNLALLQILFLVSTVLFSFIYFLRLHCLGSLEHSVISIQQDSVRNWMLLFPYKSEMKKVKLMHTSFISNHLIILIYKPDSARYFYKKYTILITRDSVSKKEFRILKAKINMQPPDLNH